MNQMPLLPLERPMVRVETPAAKRTDPETSHLAAEQHTRSGRRGQQQSQAIAAVRAFPGCTSFELAMKSEQCRFQLARRLPECETAGAVRRGDPKPCPVTGKQALTWWPANS